MAMRIHKRLSTTLQITTLAAALLAASSASAEHRGEGYYAWVDVVDVDPIVRTDYVDEPVERCWDTRSNDRRSASWRGDDRSRRAHGHDRGHDRGRGRGHDRGHGRDRDQYRDHYRDHDRGRRDGADPGAVLLGGAIGGLVGNQFGGGNGKKALTVVGAVLGASIAAEATRGGSRGHDYRRDDRHDYRDTGWRDEPVRRCEVTYESRPVERISGYEVSYRYHGRRFTKVVDEHPGDRMRVRVDVQPVV
ncbi:MAG TPA: hypothetical protein VLA56_03765 [Pseudomonadales bacterium]|nr:hypothetical protein [Pseudomonadales bacterium]